MVALPHPPLLWLSRPEALLAFFTFLVFLVTANRRRAIPIDWPFFGMLPGLLANFHRVHDFATNILSASGCTFLLKGPWRASMDILITADPANVNHIFNTNFSNYPKGTHFAEIFDVLGRGIFNADGDDWKRQRKLTHSLMAEHSFRRYVVDTSRMKVERGLLPILEKTAGERSVVDLQDLFLRFTFDSTSILVMGVDPLCLTPTLGNIPFANAMDDVEEIAAYRHILPVPFWKLLRRLNLFHERRHAEAWRTIDRCVEAYVSKRKELLHKSVEDPKPQEASPDLLSSFLQVDGGAEEIKSGMFLRDSAVNLMLAGRDTTASGLSWFFWLVSLHPRVEEKILEEMQQQEEEELGRMVYLHAALLETLRLYPPVPFEHKQAVEEELLPSGHRITPEMRLIVSLYAMARMEGVWGGDCREFKPERWINERGKLRHEPSYKFMSFNSGPRTCLGKDIAFTQMKVVAAAVLRRFQLEPVSGHKVEPKSSILLHMKNGMLVRVKTRV